MTPKRLGPEDVERYVDLRQRMLVAAPWAFGATPDDDRGSDASHLRQAATSEHFAIFVVDDGHELVASAGVMRAGRAKHAHRATIWGVYVDETHRGKGYGRAVVQAAIELAASWSGVDWVGLGVSSNSPEAESLYTSVGFVEWGREPEATEVNGVRYDEIHMACRLR